MKEYKPVIGLEIHVELKTKSKMFCQCDANYFGKDPNTNVCPVCLGMPGALPVPNKQAIEWTILIGKALNCGINKISKFDRKHYFYPDLPKGYQISQYDEPLCINGHVNIHTANGDKKFRIHRVHLEEDTGKLNHSGSDTLIDFNRSSVPLVEIVTEPDFDNSEDVKQFLEELHTIIEYLNVSDADMEKGSMRLEPNISVRVVPDVIANEVKKSRTEIAASSSTPRNDTRFTLANGEKIILPNYKVEVKNINSFNFVKKAIEYEVKRHIELLEKGETPPQETRGFNEDRGKTYSQRSKENAQDYRYFPEPDIPPLEFTDDYLKKVEGMLPELPHQKVERYEKELGLKYQDAFTLTRDKNVMEYFEACVALAKNHKDQKDLSTKIATAIINKRVDMKQNHEAFVKAVVEMYKPKETDLGQLGSVIDKVLAANQKVVDDYKSGKQQAIMFLLGQVMREMKGQADANTVRQELLKKIV